MPFDFPHLDCDDLLSDGWSGGLQRVLGLRPKAEQKHQNQRRHRHLLR